MKNLNNKIGIKLIISIGLASFILIGSPVVLADAPAPAAPGSTTASSSTSSGTKVIQPAIIPTNSGNNKLYLPHDTSSESTGSFLQNRLLPGIATTIIALTGGLSLLFVILAGIQLLTAYANPDAGEKAKKTLTYAIAGLIISTLSYGIVTLIASLTSVGK